LNYYLSRVVQRTNDDSNDIPAKKPYDIEVMPETLMTFRLNTKVQSAPARV
jgi:hypothetical protein